MDEDGKSFVPRVFGFKNERAVLRTWGRAATMSFLMTQKKKIKSLRLVVPTFFGWGGNAVCTPRALSF